MSQRVVYTPAQEFSMRLLLNGIDHQQRADLAITTPVPVRTALPGRKVLVLAPHLDDEVIGCAGLIRSYCAAGAEVTVLFVTCGSGGHASESLEAREKGRQRRLQECQAALTCLGPLESLFCNLPERKLATHLPQSDFLAGLLRTEYFDVVFAPGPTEIHPDHIAVWRWVKAAVIETSSSVTLYAYEVWGSCNPSVLLHLEPAVWETKKRAMAAYQSQIRHLDYSRLMDQLSEASRRFPWLAGETVRTEGFRLIQRRSA